MPRVTLHSLAQLRTFRALLGATLVLGATATIIGLIALLLPGLARPLSLPLGATLVAGALLSGILLYAAYVNLKQDISRAVATVEHSLASAHRDALTGALTRSYFIEQLQERLHNADKSPLAYVQIDMDHLKQINDGSGHAVGDAALAHLAETIGTMLPDAIVGRLGGDEFGVIIPDHDNTHAIARVCRQMLAALSAPTMIAGRHFSISATAGFAIAPHHSGQTDDLMSKADLALYKGKKGGRNAVVAFEEDLLGDERHKRFIERELRAAIMMEELDLHYQPIYETDGITLKAYEALVRWNHPVRGLIPPSDFVPIAESGELIDKLGDWVLRRACADFSKLKAPYLSINVSPRQLRRPDFPARFSAILEEANVPATGLAIEITETVPLAAEGVEKINLDRIKAFGARIAIDDFGSGNASLSYLKRSSFDILKIDRSYIENIATSRFDALVVASICRIARASNMSVIAEGIETAEQMRAVTAAGATALQGFFLGRPQPLRTILADRREVKSADAA